MTRSSLLPIAIVPILLCWGGVSPAAGAQAAAPQNPPAAATDANPEAKPLADEVLLRLLKDGEMEERLAALHQVAPRLKERPDVFLPAMIECARESDPRMRFTTINLIGQTLIWVEGPQNQQAIDFALEMSRDEDPDVVHSCVYFCLSTARNRSDAVIDRLIELVAPRPGFRNELGRIQWGLQGEEKHAAERIESYLARPEGVPERNAAAAAELHYRLTGEIPKNLARYADAGEFVVFLSLSLPFQPMSNDDAKAILRNQVGRDERAYQIYTGSERGEYFAAVLVKGIANHLKLLSTVDSTDGLKLFESATITDELRPRVEEAIKQIRERPESPAEHVSYEKAFRELYDKLGRDYPNFKLKEIDWRKVGDELLPLSQTPMTVAEFSLLCQRLVARLEDSHAMLSKGTAEPAMMPMPRWDPGFACLIDDRDRPVVYQVERGSPAETAGLQPGMAIVSVNGVPAAAAIDGYADQLREYYGFSSPRLLRHDAVRGFVRQRQRGAVVRLEFEDADGNAGKAELSASIDSRYLPRLPVPIPGVNDSANVSFTKLDDGIGYIYVRRIRQDLIESLDQTVGELNDSKGLVIDVRGNSGGGFDADRSFRNFDPQDTEEPDRPRFRGPIAVLIDPGCISAGEGWISWFAANKRARFFGETTAGASSRKTTVPVADGLFHVTYPVKAYTGFLDRPIERLGIPPDVPVRQNAKDLSQGVDTVLQAAKKYLVEVAKANKP